VTKIFADESPDELLNRARRIACFNNSDWPTELSPNQIAALMAKGWNKEHLQDYRDKKSLVSEAIKKGWLLVRTEEHHNPRKTIRKVQYDKFGNRAYLYQAVQAQYTTRQKIGARDCADWLKSRGINANEYIAEWLRVGGIVLGGTKGKQSADLVYADSPINIKEQRIIKIISILEELGYDPMSVPIGGKAKTKNECLKFTKLFAENTFESAWKCASKNNRLSIANKERYIYGY